MGKAVSCERTCKANAKAKAVAKAKRSQSQPPTSLIQHSDLAKDDQLPDQNESLQPLPEDDDYPADDDDYLADYDDDYPAKEYDHDIPPPCDGDAGFDDYPGYKWDEEKEAQVKISEGALWEDLQEEDKWFYAHQIEAAEIVFDPWPQAAKTLGWCVSLGETVAAGSIILQKAMQWMRQAEDPLIKSWRDFFRDPPYLAKFNQKCEVGFMEVIRKRTALKTKV